MVKNIIRQYVRKRTTKKDKEGIMITLPDSEQVDFKVSLITEILMRNGVDPNTIKTDEMLENVMAAIERKESMEQGIVASRQADVFNTAGQKLDPNQPIIGGTQPGKAIDQDAFRRLAERNPQLIKQRIADRRVETDAEIQARLEKGNEESLARIRNQQKMLEEAIDDASPGFANDIKVDAELVAENLAERMGLVYDDLPTKQRLDLYDQAYTGLSKQRFKNMRKPDDDPEEKADGGRIGFKMGRRAFLKALGAGIGGAAALKTGMLKILGKEGTKQAADVAVTSSGKVPPYFLKLAEQIKLLGKQSSGPQERVNVYSMKGKDGKSELMLTEDVGTGEMQIKKIGKENDEMVTEVQTMEYTPGKAQADETTKGTPADQYEEYTEYNSRIQKDEFNDPQIEDGIDAEDISKEIKDKFDVEQEILEEVASKKKVKPD